MATHYWSASADGSFATAGNYSDSNAPANNDTIIFSGAYSNANVTSGLSTVLTGVTIIVEKSYTGSIGVLSGATATYLVLDGGTLHFNRNTGAANGTGTTLCMVNFGSTAATVFCYDSATLAGSLPPLLVKGTSVTATQVGGGFGFCALPGETGTATAINVVGGTPTVGAKLYVGEGATVTAFTAAAGTIQNRSNNTLPSVILTGTASYEALGSGVHTVATIGPGATFYHSGSGNIPTLNVNGIYDRSRDTRAVTIGGTAFNIYSGATLNMNNGKSASVTRSNKTFVNCSIQDIDIFLPVGEQF